MTVARVVINSDYGFPAAEVHESFHYSKGTTFVGGCLVPGCLVDFHAQDDQDDAIQHASQHVQDRHRSWRG